MQVATEITTFTCICCPLGCRLEVSFGEDGQVEVEGTITALHYEEPKQSGGWLSRLLG